MSEPLDPLPPRAQQLLRDVMPPEPPDDAADRVLKRLHSSIAGAPPVPVPPAPAAVAAGSSVLAVAGTTLLVGLGVGILLGRTMFAPPPLPPLPAQIIEKVRVVEVPAPVPVPVAEPEKPAAALAAAPEKPAARVLPAPKTVLPGVDVQLARERELVDTARSALMRGSAADALVAVKAHDVEFGAGRLAEERESLWIQALVMDGKLEPARQRAASFHVKFPRSLLGPTVDAAIASP